VYRPLVRRGIAAIAVSVVLVTGLTAAGPAAAPPAALPAPSACPLEPASDSSEWGSCLQVSATLASPPKVGETVVLGFEVRASQPLDGVTVEAELPGGLAWAAQPAGMRTEVRASSRPEDRGRLERAVAVGSVAADRPLRFEGQVRAVAAGPAQIRVQASAPAGPEAGAAQDSVFVTVGDAGMPAAFGVRVPAETAAEAQGTGAGQRPQVAAGPGQACLSGTTGYVDERSQSRPSRGLRVEVWDHDGDAPDDRMAVGATNDAGNFVVCFDNLDPDGNDRWADPYAKFVTSHERWSVQRRQGGAVGEPYVWSLRRQWLTNVKDGQIVDTGSFRPLNTDPAMRALRAFDKAYQTWRFVPGNCWDRYDRPEDCRRIEIIWTPDSTTGTYYRREGDAVFLRAADPDERDTVAHELGHAVMDDLYEDAYPATDNCNPHVVTRFSSAGCAWSEGFAEWFSSAVAGDPRIVYTPGVMIDLENPTWGTAGWQNGETVEGRVAGALIDLSDAANEPPWDRLNTGAGSGGEVWSLVERRRSATFEEFWRQWAEDDLDVSDDALATLYQNTIDRGIATRSRPAPRCGGPRPVPTTTR
jgi:hypothetical protein